MSPMDCLSRIHRLQLLLFQFYPNAAIKTPSLSANVYLYFAQNCLIIPNKCLQQKMGEFQLKF